MLLREPPFCFMKTRIVKPKLWTDPSFVEFKPTTKLLFMYLVTNDQLGLSPYLQITDRQMMFDTGLNSAQLEESKKEIQGSGLILFAENWTFHNHDLAYVDYEGRDRVVESKQLEIGAVPQHVKEVLNGLITGYKPVLNHKPKTINPKSKTLNQKQAFENLTKEMVLKKFGGLEGVASGIDIVLEYSKAVDWLSATGKTYKNYDSFFRNWLRRASDSNGKKKGGVLYVE